MLRKSLFLRVISNTSALLTAFVYQTSLNETGRNPFLNPCIIFKLKNNISLGKLINKFKKNCYHDLRARGHLIKTLVNIFSIPMPTSALIYTTYIPAVRKSAHPTGQTPGK
jgi:hypothetical protein